jgi:HAD superfamily hydrolase (TIGR01456 family)
MSTTSVPVAVAFDVDGVLLRGKEPIPGAADALRKLQQNNIPYVFVTNGGGCLESEKAAQISSVLGVPLQPEQVVLAHSPFRDLATRLAHQEVLVVGKRRIHHIAHEYGTSGT